MQSNFVKRSLPGSTASTGIDVPIDLTGQMASALRQVSMIVNPSTVAFSQAKRFTKQDTIVGSVIHHFTDEKGQNLDLLNIRMQGSTGNIFRLGPTEEERMNAVARLKVWHNLYQLTREPEIYVTDTGKTRKNTFYIVYTSPLIPVPITFEGYFPKPLEWQETGDKFSRNYSLDFVVTRTLPDINTMAQGVIDWVTQVAQAIPSDDSRTLTS